MRTEETALVTAAKGGDEAAFESLVRLYEKKVYGLSLRMCGNPEDAAEVAQEAFLSAWQGLAFFRQDSEFSTWLYRLTSNAAIDFLRREKRQKAAGDLALDADDSFFELPDARPSQEVLLEQKELQECILQGLAALSDEHRQVLILRELQQLSYEEIAETLELDAGTVKSRISRGRKQLRNFLLQKGNFFKNPSSKRTETEGCK